MLLVRRVARPLLGSAFLLSGWDAVRNPAPKAAGLQPMVTQLRTNASLPLPDDTTMIVRADGAAKLLAGTALSLGRMPRLSAAVLAASLVPTTLAEHRFWAEKDPARRAEQKAQFFKSLSMLGGVLLAVVDTEGKPSLGWRTRQVARDLGDTLRDVGSDAVATAAHAQLAASAKAHEAVGAGRKVFSG